VALTRKGVDFLEQNHNALISQFLPNGLSFDVPPSKSSNVEVCRNPPCKVTGKINRLKIGLIPAKTVRTELWVDIHSTKIELRVSQKIGFITLRKTCDVYAQIKNKHITSDIALGIDAQTKQLTFQLGTPSFSLSNSDFKISGDIICSLVDLLKGLFKGLIEKEIKKALQDALDDISCMTCKQTSDCPQSATCSGGKCVKGGKCLPMPMGMEGALDTASLLAGFGNKHSSDLWFSAHVGGRAEVKTSAIELGMLGGTHAQANSCVPAHNFPKLPSPPLFAFPALAPDGQAYMLGIGVSQIMLTQAMRDLYSSGVICIKIDSSISDQLPNIFTAKGIGGLISPSIVKLVGNGDAPIYIALRPTEPPQIAIGKGVIGQDAKGQAIIQEPLFDVSIPKLQFDFMMMLHDRWIKLFTYQIDVSLALALEVKPGNKLGLVLSDLSTAMTNPSVLNSNILQEDPQRMANGLHNLLQAILPMATGALGNQEFDLPKVQGFELAIRGIGGEMPRVDRPDRYHFFGLFADLSLAPPVKPQLPEAEISLRLLRIDIPPDFAHRVRQRELLRQYPMVALAIDDVRPDREYSFRINNGMWGPYADQRHPMIESPQFLIEGTHRIETRSRSKLAPHLADTGFGTLSVRIDYTSPQVTLLQTPRGISIRALDNIATSEQIRVKYRIDNGSWLDLSSTDLIARSNLSEGSTIEVVAIDPDHNRRVVQMTWDPAIIEQQPQPKHGLSQPSQGSKLVSGTGETAQHSDRAWSCQQLDLRVGSVADISLLVLLISILLYWRRRRAGYELKL
jgi:hypothetical protein